LEDQRVESNEALDLVDALTRSGSLPLAHGELHVLIGVRYSFEQICMATNLEEIINPIEQVDRSSMLIAAMVHQKEIPSALLRRRWSKDALTGANGTSIHIIDWRQRHCRLFCNYLSKQCNYTSFNPAA